MHPAQSCMRRRCPGPQGCSSHHSLDSLAHGMALSQPLVRRRQNTRAYALHTELLQAHLIQHLGPAFQLPDPAAHAALVARVGGGFWQDADVPATWGIHSAPHNATAWFCSVCVCSVALGSLLYSSFARLAEQNFIALNQQLRQKRRMLHGVDVTNSRFFEDERVLAALAFAAEAHAGQVRKTGEPYVAHCIETALIVEHNLPPAAEIERYTLAIMAALLHDVIDDTPTDLQAIQAKFGSQVAGMVGQVSQLSQMNQLLRRGQRMGWAEYGPQHFKALRKMIVDLVFDEPLVILIKLADRLHNMRTVYVLKPEKQKAVAEETLEVWCTMAECLGWDALKSEMEDLCFAVLQPEAYCALRAQLDRIWSIKSLQVVVEQADSSLLPANALAPAPPLTARGRRAAAASAARKEAAAIRAADTLTAAAARRRSWTIPDPDASSQDAVPTTRAAMANSVVPSGGLSGLQFQLQRVQRAAAGGLGSGGTVTSTTASASVAQRQGTLPISRPGMAAAPPTDAGAARCSSPEGIPASAAHPGTTVAPALNSPIPLLSSPTAPAIAAAPSTALSSSAATAGTSPHSLSAVSSVPAALTSSVVISGTSAAAAASQAQASATSSLSEPLSLPAVNLTVSKSPASPPASKVSAFVEERIRSELASLAGALPPSTAIDAPVQPLKAVLFTEQQLLASQAPVSSLAPAELGSSQGPPSPQQEPGWQKWQGLVAWLPQLQAQQGLRSPTTARASMQVPGGRGPDVPGKSKVESLQQERLRGLLSTVVPFDSVNFKKSIGLHSSTRRGLEVLDECAELLYNESQLRSSCGGLTLLIEGRLKSIQSVYRKMVRKGCSVAQVYDARALRVIVGDEGGERTLDSVGTCYKLVSAVHSIWKPITHEFDDYIANPKPSGYQALHTAVKGPGGIPMEVQIKTSSMHNLAEFGAAAHWVYKESEVSVTSPQAIIPLPVMPMPSPLSSNQAARRSSSQPLPGTTLPEATSASIDVEVVPTGPERIKGRGWAGQPVLRVAGGKLRYGAVVQTEGEGRQLLVAVRAGPTSAAYPTRVSDYGFYAALAAYAEDKGWQVPGNSDFNVRLELFVLANDGRYHRKDHLDYVLPGETLTLLEGYEEEADLHTARRARELAAAALGSTNLIERPAEGRAAEMMSVAAACTGSAMGSAMGSATGSAMGSSDAGEDGQVVGATATMTQPPTSSTSPPARSPDAVAKDEVAERLRRQMQEAYLRTAQLRTMIEWGRSAMGKYHQGGNEPGEEVSVIIWPGGAIEHWPRGTTAAQLVRAKGLISLGSRPEQPPDIRPSFMAMAGGDDGLLTIYDRIDSGIDPVRLVNVNNRLVPETTILNDGDLVILTREKVVI